MNINSDLNRVTKVTSLFGERSNSPLLTVKTNAPNQLRLTIDRNSQPLDLPPYENLAA